MESGSGTGEKKGSCLKPIIIGSQKDNCKKIYIYQGGGVGFPFRKFEVEGKNTHDRY